MARQVIASGKALKTQTITGVSKMSQEFLSRILEQKAA